MKTIGIILVLIAVLVGGWYTLSPLFINNTVDEAFPEAETTEDSSQGEEQKKSKMMILPSEKMVDALSEEEQEELLKQMVDDLKDAPDVVMGDELMPKEEQGTTTEEEVVEEAALPEILFAGNFKDADAFHKGSGKASVYELSDGKQILRFEDFSVTNGPELHVLLSSHPDPKSRADVKDGGFLDLGKLKGNKGNQNYTLPEDFFDAEKYQSIVIYCAPFNVVFSTASLGSLAPLE